MIETESLHQRLGRLWPAAEEEARGGWLLRADPSATKRANSIGVFGPPDRPVAEAFAEAALWLKARGKPPLAQIRMDEAARHEPAALWLRARGAAPFDETRVLTLALGDLAATPESPHLRVVAPEEPPPGWAEVESHGPADFPARLAVMRRVKIRRFMTLSEGAAIQAVAWLGLEGDLALIAAVSTRPKAQGRGIGGALMAATLRAAADLGAKTAALQVEAGNAKAAALYARLGFAEAYRYAYAPIPP